MTGTQGVTGTIFTKDFNMKTFEEKGLSLFKKCSFFLVFLCYNYIYNTKEEQKWIKKNLIMNYKKY